MDTEKQLLSNGQNQVNTIQFNWDILTSLRIFCNLSLLKYFFLFFIDFINGVAMLLEAGADPHIRDERNKSAFDYAVQYGRYIILNLVLKRV